MIQGESCITNRGFNSETYNDEAVGEGGMREEGRGKQATERKCKKQIWARVGGNESREGARYCPTRNATPTQKIITLNLP